MAYADGSYWSKRSDSLYYQYLHFIIRCIGADAQSMIDVGSGNCPYLDWFDWIDEKVSIDIWAPYASPQVRAIKGNILTTDVGKQFDVCTCLQVLEHVEDPGPFARRLFELGKIVLVSVPFEWPEGKTKGHVNDPVDLEKVVSWFEREPNWSLTVNEPFVGQRGKRMFALFDVDNPTKKYGYDTYQGRRPVEAA